MIRISTDEPSTPTSSSIVLGCSVAIISSAVQSLGITLQRKSHLVHFHKNNSNASNHHHHQRYKRNMWLFGFTLFIVANLLGSLIQITTLPLIILSPLQSIGLIFNSVTSCLLLPGETFTKNLGLGTLVIAVGACIIAYNGNVPPLQPSDNDKVDQKFKLVLSKLLRKSFLIWFIGTFVMIGILLLISLIISNKKSKVKLKLKRRTNRILVKSLNKYQFLKGINYGIISGTLTAHTFLFAKSLVDVIVETILSDHHNFKQIFTSSNFTPYLLLIIMLTIVGFQLTAFNLGLSQISTSILYPLCFLVYNLFNLINGLLFNSLISDHRMSIYQLIWIIIGLFGVLFGVVLISWDSAFGNGIKDLSGLTTEEEFIVCSNFPYNQQFNESTRLQNKLSSNSFENPDHNYSSIKPNDSDTTIQVYQLEDDFNNPTKDHRRVLSFEQNQLLHSIDF